MCFIFCLTVVATYVIFPSVFVSLAGSENFNEVINFQITQTTMKDEVSKQQKSQEMEGQRACQEEDPKNGWGINPPEDSSSSEEATRGGGCSIM